MRLFLLFHVLFLLYKRKLRYFWYRRLYLNGALAMLLFIFKKHFLLEFLELLKCHIPLELKSHLYTLEPRSYVNTLAIYRHVLQVPRNLIQPPFDTFLCCKMQHHKCKFIINYDIIKLVLGGKK